MEGIYGEQPRVSIDFDNNGKTESLALNDESYLLFHFAGQLSDFVSVQPIYPIGLGNEGDESLGCLDCGFLALKNSSKWQLLNTSFQMTICNHYDNLIIQL